METKSTSPASFWLRPSFSMGDKNSLSDNLLTKYLSFFLLLFASDVMPKGHSGAFSLRKRLITIHRFVMRAARQSGLCARVLRALIWALNQPAPTWTLPH